MKQILFYATLAALVISSCGKDMVTKRKEMADSLNQQNAGQYSYYYTCWDGDPVDLDGDGKRDNLYEELLSYFRATGMDPQLVSSKVWPANNYIDPLCQTDSDPSVYSCYSRVALPMQVVVKDKESGEMVLPNAPGTVNGMDVQIKVLFNLESRYQLSPDLEKKCYISSSSDQAEPYTYIDKVDMATIGTGDLRLRVSGQFYDMSAKEFVHTGYYVCLRRVAQ